MDVDTSTSHMRKQADICTQAHLYTYMLKHHWRRWHSASPAKSAVSLSIISFILLRCCALLYNKCHT